MQYYWVFFIFWVVKVWRGFVKPFFDGSADCSLSSTALLWRVNGYFDKWLTFPLQLDTQLVFL